MPQVNISIAQKLDAVAMNEFQLDIAKNINLLPGKSTKNTIICIQDGCAMFKADKPLDGAFVDVRLYRALPEESKKAFSEKMYSMLKERFNIDPNAVYMNYVELEHWASEGRYY